MKGRVAEKLEQSALLPVWTRIVAELALHQDLAPPEFSGQVVNPICGTVYILDTAFAAKVFRSAILFPITFGTLPYVVLATRLAMARLVGFEATHLLVRPPNFKRILR